MIRRVDQQLRVTEMMMRACNLSALLDTNEKLARYMARYLSMMVTISSLLLLAKSSPETEKKRDALWDCLERADRATYRKIRYRSLATVTILPGRAGRIFALRRYSIAQSLYHFQ